MTNNDIQNLRQVIREEVKGVVSEELKPVNERLGSVEDKVDALTAEMYEVQEKTGATYDLVKGTFESNKMRLMKSKNI